MAFDEKGQADTFERKIEICRRAYRLLIEKCGYDRNDIIFDVNVMAVATGIEEHNRYALDFIRAVEWIKKKSARGSHKRRDKQSFICVQREEHLARSYARCVSVSCHQSRS